jgi:hypothetical protein
MLILRSNVSLWNLKPQGQVILQIVEGVFEKILGPSLDSEVTSGNDSSHMEGSYHYKGLAFDFSIARVVAVSKVFLAAAVASALGGTGKETRLSTTALLYDGGDFDVLLENLGGENEHLHVEWDEKRAASRHGVIPPEV